MQGPFVLELQSPFFAKSLKMLSLMNFMTMFFPSPWPSALAFSMYSFHKEVGVFDIATRSKGLVNAQTGAHKVEPEMPTDDEGGGGAGGGRR